MNLSWSRRLLPGGTLPFLHYSASLPSDLEPDPEDEPELASESITWRNPPSSISQFLVLLPF
jgi:hypothetical protein